MSRRRNLSESSDSTDINISPMIDMVFILLIFFIVTTVFVEEDGLDVNKPQPSTAQTQEDKEILVFLVTARGQIFHEDLEIGLSAVRPTVSRATGKEKPPVIIEVEQAAPAGIMVRIMDEAKIAGAEAISINQAR